MWSKAGERTWICHVNGVSIMIQKSVNLRAGYEVLANTGHEEPDRIVMVGTANTLEEAEVSAMRYIRQEVVRGYNEGGRSHIERGE